ncbi:MAG TPA: hypothetical protein VGJ82_08365, partial [Thermoanaerobaculia bacterium]|jgi:hypothetical protein
MRFALARRVVFGTICFYLSAMSAAAASPKKEQTHAPRSSSKSGKTDKLPPFDQAKLEGSMAKLTWSLALQYRNAEYAPKDADALKADLTKDETFSVHPLLAPYRERLQRLATQLGIFGDSITYFLYGEKGDFPFDIVDYKGSKCFVALIATGDVINTLRLATPRQRAVKMASSHALPAIRAVADELEGTDVKTVAVFVTFGTKDFTDDSVLATKAETLGLVSSAADARAFHNGDISDSEFLRKATVLISDRDTSLEFTKTELQMQ